jgi:hypothetical protein
MVMRNVVARARPVVAPASVAADAAGLGEGGSSRPSGGRAGAHVLQGRSAGQAAPPPQASPAATAPTSFQGLPEDALRLTARRLPVRDRANLALAGPGLAGPVRQSLECLSPLALQVRDVAELPAGEPRLRAALDAVFASAQPQLTASEQAWLLRAAVVRTDLLEPPHRFVLHRVACEQCRHLPDDEKAALIAVLAQQIPKLPQWLEPQSPQPELGAVFRRLAGPSDPGQPLPPIFEAGIPAGAKKACAAALAAQFVPLPRGETGSIAVTREAFEDCRRLALELPASLRAAPLRALADQICQLPMHSADPHPPRRRGLWGMMEVGVARILAHTAALPPEDRLRGLSGLVQNFRTVPGKAYWELQQQVWQHLVTHPLPPVHRSTLDELLRRIDVDWVRLDEAR